MWSRYQNTLQRMVMALSNPDNPSRLHSLFQRVGVMLAGSIVQRDRASFMVPDCGADLLEGDMRGVIWSADCRVCRSK